VTPSTRRATLTLAIAAGLIVASATSASAESLTVTDPRGDLRAYDVENGEPGNAGSVSNGDIVRSVLRHGDTRISVRVKFSELRKIGEFRGDAIRVVTNEGVKRDVSTSAGPGMWSGESDMSRPNGTLVDCAVAHRIDYDRNVVTVSFPRSCVSNPRWVRLGVGAMWMSSGTGMYYVDDAQVDGNVNDSVRLSPRLSRG
jgi:hypothetical protein